jgi:hypothetical protein
LAVDVGMCSPNSIRDGLLVTRLQQYLSAAAWQVIEVLGQ